MTSPQRLGTSAPATPGMGSANGPYATAGASTSRETFQAPPTLELRTDLRNPIRSPLQRRVATLGDVREAIIQDFIGGQLREGGRGAQVVQQLGSFPGYRHPERPLNQWNPDQKPDFNIIGESDVILRKLQPMMGWDEATLEANLERARRGMVYFNQAIETPEGPIPFKMGILDTQLWREGHFYYDLRASLLPYENTYRFLNGTEHGTTIPEADFFERQRQVEAEMMGRTLESFVFGSGFSAEQLMARRYQHNFGFYEFYRVFDWFKGAKQRRKYQNTSEGNLVPKILAPGLQRWLMENPNRLRVTHPELGTIGPEQINESNLAELHFTWETSLRSRLASWPARFREWLGINRQNWAQTRLNIASNGTSRPSHHSIGWVQYGARKFGRFFGVDNGYRPRFYTPESSHFLDQGGIPAEQRRLGITSNPIDQMIILAGYGPQDERDPATWERMVNYAEAEISKGAKPNILIRGNNPSKFTFPVRGVPAIAYRLMDGLRSEGIKTIVVVGPPDVGATMEAFESFFADEIRQRGKTLIYENTGLGEGGFTVNLKQGLNRLPNRDGIALLSYGDTPRVDLMNVAHHPWRHSMDYIFGANGRDMVLDFMGMNAHYQADIDGVGYPSKEGNVQAVRSQFPMDFWQRIFNNRKSVLSGPWGKVYIGLRYLFMRPLEPLTWRTLPNYMGALAADLFSPRMGTPDVMSLLFADIAPRSVRNVIHRLGSRGSAKPPWAAMNVETVEDVFRTQMRWNSDFRATHLDPGALVDIDGIRDYIVAEVLSNVHPHEHQRDLDRFAREGLDPYRDRIPALQNTGPRINEIYTNLRETLLERESARPTGEKLGITEDTLRRMGFDSEVLPFTEQGEVNEAWLQRVIPQSEIQAFRRAFLAYENRGEHAKTLASEFQLRLHNRREYAESERVDSRIERFVLKEINAEPERMRGRVLEWGFDRVESTILERAPTADREEIRRYFELSTSGLRDTPLRRVLLGLKAVDVLRRYQSNLSPAEFQTLFPNLVEVIHEAQEVSPKHQTWSKGPIPHLAQYFEIAGRTADQIYIRKVGESPPPYRSRGWRANRLPSSYARNPVERRGDQAAPVNGAAQLSLSEARALRGDIFRVDSPVFLQSDLNLMARRLNILPSRIPELIAAASGVQSPDQLNRISGEASAPARGGVEGRPSVPEIPALGSERIGFERLLAWTQSTEGQRYLSENAPRMQDRFQGRMLEAGPGLGLGIASLLGAEWAATQIGLDPVKNPHERFMFVVGTSHLVNAGYNNFHEVLMNRFYHRTPFNFATTRMVHGGSRAAVQYSFEARPNWLRAAGASLTRSYGLRGGIGGMAMRGTKGLVTLPFRASWNMGPGLMSAALTDRILSEGILELEQGSTARRAIHFGSFFAPDVYRIAYGHRGAAFLRSPAMRVASRAFAAGFIADMGFSAVNRIQNGSDGATRMSMIYQRANELNDAENGNWFTNLGDGAFELVAPQLAAYWDSVEFQGLSLRPNRFHRQADREIQEFSQAVETNAQGLLQDRLLRGQGEEDLEESFYTRVDMNFLRQENRLQDQEGERNLPTSLFAEDLAASRQIREEFYALDTPQARRRYLQNRYSGWNLSEADAGLVLDRILVHRVRSDLASVSAMPFQSGNDYQALFDEDGVLREGQEDVLLSQVFADSEMNETELLRARRVRLAFLVMQLDEGTIQMSTERAGRLRNLAVSLGLRRDSGAWENHSEVQAARQMLEQIHRNQGPRTTALSIPSSVSFRTEATSS